MRMKVRTKMRGEEGAAAVEFALIVGLLSMLIFGMMEYGLAFWQLQNLRAASREGARVAAVGGTGAQILNAVNQEGNVQLTSANVKVCLPPAACQALNSSQKYCGLDGQPIDQSVVVQLPAATLPSGIRSIFRIEIPLLPPFTLNPDISGTFRCEGTSG
jgi:Flp pilus assembly pilin Flp